MQEEDQINEQNPTEDMPCIQLLSDKSISIFQHYYEKNLKDFTILEISDDPLKVDADDEHLIATRKDSRICSNKKKQKFQRKKTIKKINTGTNKKSSSKMSDVLLNWNHRINHWYYLKDSQGDNNCNY